MKPNDGNKWNKLIVVSNTGLLAKYPGISQRGVELTGVNAGGPQAAPPRPPNAFLGRGNEQADTLHPRLSCPQNFHCEHEGASGSKVNAKPFCGLN